MLLFQTLRHRKYHLCGRQVLQFSKLSIKQLIFYHTAIQVWKVKASESPVYINSKYNPSNTRSSIQGTLLVPVVEKTTYNKSTWNHLPQDMRNIKNLSTFKVNLKTWRKESISIEWTKFNILQTTHHFTPSPTSEVFTGKSCFLQ